MNAAKTKKPKTPKRITETYLHNAGLYYLQRFAASRGQFRQVMLRKVKKSCLHHKDQDYDSCVTLVDGLIEKFVRAGLLNDEIYAQGAISSLRRQGKSRRSILNRLQSRGIDPALANEKLEAVDSEYTNAEQRAVLLFLRRKKLGPFNAEKEDVPEKTMASLARAGFSYETVRSVLNFSQEEADKILNG